MKKINEVVRSLREDYDLKQKDVAAFLKLSRTTYNHYELGHCSFTAEMIIALANFFNTTPNVLLNFDNTFEVTDPDLIKLCNYIRDNNVDVEALLALIEASRKMNS